MKNKDNFNIEIPQNIKSPKANKGIQKQEHIDTLKDIIKTQYDEVCRNQDIEITEKNKKEIEDLILATQDLINNCINDNYYSGNRDDKFVSLIYICHKLDLKLETYKLTTKINELNDTSNEIIKRQNKTEEQNNNLVYNLLGFLTAFSIVSAVVGVIANINGTINIMLFMAFTILLLLTTLIGLHNFYENNNKRETKLQDNYFLWQVVATIIIVLVLVLGIKTVNDNKENIFNYLDTKIEKVIEEKTMKKISNEEN